MNKYGFQIRFLASHTTAWPCYHYIAAEMPPQARVIHFEGKSYYISLPWVIFVLAYQETGRMFKGGEIEVFFRDKSLESLDSLVVPNPWSRNGYVCLGEDKPSDRYSTLEEMVAAFIQAFFATEFNIPPSEIIDLNHWDICTREDPKCGTKYPWMEKFPSLPLRETSWWRYTHEQTNLQFPDSGHTG